MADLIKIENDSLSTNGVITDTSCTGSKSEENSNDKGCNNNSIHGLNGFCLNSSNSTSNTNSPASGDDVELPTKQEIKGIISVKDSSDDGNHDKTGSNRSYTGNCLTYTSDNDVYYQPGDCAYIENSRADQPYYICTIKRFHMIKQALQVTVQWYYRSSEVPHSVYHLLGQDRNADNGGKDGLYRILNEPAVKQKELFSSSITDVYPASALRGKCKVTHMIDVKTLRDLVSVSDTFFYIFGYNPETRRLANTQGEIRVGPSHQAILPDLCSSPPDDLYEDKEFETKVWAPPENDEDIKSYLDASNSMVTAVASLDQGKTEDSDYLISYCTVAYNALMKLHENNFDTEAAMQCLTEKPLPKSFLRVWNDDDTKRFVKGLRLYGKNFHRIRRELFSDKETGDLIEFYYHWKKTKGAANAKAYRKHRRNVRRSRAPRPSRNRSNKSEFPDVSSASEDAVSGEECKKNRGLYCCRHCFTYSSRSWHHAGIDKQLLCDDCRIYFKKYGEMKYFAHSPKPPLQLLKSCEKEKEKEMEMEKEKPKEKREETDISRKRPRRLGIRIRCNNRSMRSRSSTSNSDSSSTDSTHQRDRTGNNMMVESHSSSNGLIVEKKSRKKGRKTPKRTVTTKRAANKELDNKRPQKRPKIKLPPQKSVSSDCETDNSCTSSATSIDEKPRINNNGNSSKSRINDNGNSSKPRINDNGNSSNTDGNATKDQVHPHSSMSVQFVKRFPNIEGSFGSARTDLSCKPFKKATIYAETKISSAATSTAKQMKKSEKETPEDRKTPEKEHGSSSTKSAFKAQDSTPDHEENSIHRISAQEPNHSAHVAANNRFMPFGVLGCNNNLYQQAGYGVMPNTSMPSLPNMHGASGLAPFLNSIYGTNECHPAMYHGNLLQHQHHPMETGSLPLPHMHPYMPTLHGQFNSASSHPMENNFMSPLLSGSYIPPEVLSSLAMGNVPSNYLAMHPELQRSMQVYGPDGLHQALSRGMIDQASYDWAARSNAAATAAGQPSLWYNTSPMLFNVSHQGSFPPGGY